jgi:N-acetylmuramoyl-L-alanine amidase
MRLFCVWGVLLRFGVGCATSAHVATPVTRPEASPTAAVDQGAVRAADTTATPPIETWPDVTSLATRETPSAPVSPASFGLTIVDRPLPNREDRLRRMSAYLQAHSGVTPTGNPESDCTITPKVIVLHWTAGGTAETTWNSFSGAKLAGREDLQDAGDANVGSQFLVDRDGTVIRMQPEIQAARHTIGLNHVSIGVENVGGPDAPLTSAQVEANAKLVRYLTAAFPITHLIGHLEYKQMEGHPYFLEPDPAYRTGKIDPGADFMAAVRAKVKDLDLKGPRDR